MKCLDVALEPLRADADHVALGALDLAVDLRVVDARVVLGGELLAADVAGMLRGRRRVVLPDVVHEAVLALAHHSALGALFVAWNGRYTWLWFSPWVSEYSATRLVRVKHALADLPH